MEDREPIIIDSPEKLKEIEHSISFKERQEKIGTSWYSRESLDRLKEAVKVYKKKTTQMKKSNKRQSSKVKKEVTAPTRSFEYSKITFNPKKIIIVPAIFGA